MINLILAILSSAAIAVLMRLFDSKINNNMIMFFGNYLTCCICAMFFLGTESISSIKIFSTSTPGILFALGLGLISGILYLVSFILLQFNIRKNGILLASTFMKFGVLVPVLMAIIFFSESPTKYQIAGFVFALIAILVLNGNSNETVHSFSLLILLLFFGGLTDSTSNIYDKLGSPELKNHFLLFIFISAMLTSIVFAVIKKQHFTLADFLCGIGIGIPNYFSSRFLLYSLGSIPAIVVYPVYNVAVILLVSFIGVIAFHEKLGLRKAVALVLIVLSILLEVM